LGGGLAGEDRLLDHRRAATAELLRPGDPGPARGVQLALPVATEGHDLVERALWFGAGVIGTQPGRDLVAEPLLRWRQRQVHRPLTLHVPWPDGQGSFQRPRDIRPFE